MLKGSLRDEITLPKGSKVLIFENTKKSKPNDPDYNVMIEIPEVIDKSPQVSDEELYF